MADWPADSVQGLVDFDWWVPFDEPKGLRRGQLVWAFVPHVDQSPHVLEVTGRAEPTIHDQVLHRVVATKIGDRARNPGLPVAALPSLPKGDVRAVYNAKARPCLVISVGGPTVPRDPGTAAWMTLPTFSVAPYFGVDQGGARGGWRPELVDRIRHAEYPQYVWDRLPIGGKGTTESVLRLDLVQPIGRNYNSFERLPWVLSDDALALMDEWLHWLVFEGWPEGGDVLLPSVRELLLKG